MIQHWYAVYTRPQKEKKVSSLLYKKGIENYCPINYIVGAKANGRKPITVPLFNSFIFVFIAENEMRLIMNIPDIVNFMYWKSAPAVIKDEEIDLVKKLSLNYTNIKLEKICVGINSTIHVTNEPVVVTDKEELSLNYMALKVTLPSLGYTITGERQKVNNQSTNPDFVRLGGLIPKKLNSLFFN